MVCEFIARTNRDSDKSREEVKQAINTRLAEYSGVICQTIPEMKEFFLEVRVVDKVEPEKEADRIAHVLATLLLTLCDIKPLIIFIDDLQWIDLVTFEICKRVMREKPPCMLLFNYRTEANEVDLFVFGDDLRKIGIERLIHVMPFTCNETKELISSRFGEVANGKELIDMLFSKTDGNPFVLAEAVRYLVNTGHMVREEHGWTYKLVGADVLPEKFDSVSLILGKEEQLGKDERQCLKLLSLIQGKFDSSLVEKFTSINETQTKICLHRFENLGFIIAHFKGGFSFSHDRIQESIAEGISLGEKGKLFERLANIYEEMIPDNRGYVYNSAECYLKTKNLTKAIEISFKAAEYATEQIAFDVAVRYFKNTQFLLKQCAKINVAPPVDPIKAEIAFGDVLMLTGKNEQALKIFQSLLETANILTKLQRFEINYKIGAIHHNLGEYEKSIHIFEGVLFESGINVRLGTVTFILLLLLEIFCQILFSFGLRRLIPKKKGIDSLFRLRILNKLSYSQYFDDMPKAILVHFKALNLADRLFNSYEKAETYVLHAVCACQMNLRKRSIRYFERALKIANSLQRKDLIAFVQLFGGLVKYYYANWNESTALLNESVGKFESIGGVADQITGAEQLWKISFLKGRFSESLISVDKTIVLSRHVNEKHFLITALAAANLISYIKGDGVIQERMTEVDLLLNQVKSFLSHTEVGLFLTQIEIQQGKKEIAFKRLAELLPIVLRKNFNSEHHVPAFSLYCELAVHELLQREKAKPSFDITNRKLAFNFSIYSFLLWFSALNYPAHRGSYYRSRAWWHALHNRKKKAHRFFQKAVKAYHSLDMRYEEARSIRDYANFLEDFCNLPGEARDKYTEAYRLFDVCGAKLETDRIKDKVDPSFLQIKKETTEIWTDEVSANTVTSFTTAAGVNQMRVNTLYDLSNSIQNIDDISELLHRILRSMISATGAQFGGLFVNEDKVHPKQSLFMDYEGKTLTEEEVSYSQEIIDKVRDSQQVVLIRDGIRDNASSDTQHVRSVLCVPLTRGESLHGCVYLGNNIVTGLFSDDSKKTAQIIAAEASILLENAYLMDSYKRLNRDLQKKVREQTADIREKNKQLAESNLKVVDSERMKSLLAGTLVHDIKNYAAGIEGNTALLKRYFPEDPKIAKTVNMVTDCCYGIVSLASNLLDIGKMEEGKLVLKMQVITRDFLFGMANHLHQNVLFNEKNISMMLCDNTNDQFAIAADSYLMERVMQNIFSNAAKYVPRDGKVVLTLESSGNDYVVSFFNSGNPIPDKDKYSLFDKYNRGDNSQASQYSKGLGLFFCRMVMNAHGGRIWLDTDATGNYFKLAFRKKAIQSQFSPAA